MISSIDRAIQFLIINGYAAKNPLAKQFHAKWHELTDKHQKAYEAEAKLLLDDIEKVMPA